MTVGRWPKDNSCSVRAHPFEFFYSRFYSRFQIALHHTPSGRVAHRFNANIVHSLTPSHSIPISSDGLFKAKTESSAHAFPSSRLPPGTH